MKFLIAAKLSLKLVQAHLETSRDKMRNLTHYNQDYQLYAYSLPIILDYVQDRPYRGDALIADRRMYLHLYYSADRAWKDEKAFNSRLANLHAEPGKRSAPS